MKDSSKYRVECEPWMDPREYVVDPQRGSRGLAREGGQRLGWGM